MNQRNLPGWLSNGLAGCQGTLVTVSWAGFPATLLPGTEQAIESANPTASLLLARPGLAPEPVQSRLCEPAGRVGKFAHRMVTDMTTDQ